MKKTLLLALVFCLALSASAFAATIVGGPHDLSDSRTVDGTDQICVYCHHPHGTGSATLLWNINDVTGAAFTLYSSQFLAQSPSVPTDADGSGGTAECMSCHDGIIATTALVQGTINSTYTLVGVANLGTDLSDDHPVGFNYDTAQGIDGELVAIADAKANNMVFYGAGSDQMACASCHDVHNPNSSPFLRDTLSASTLCLRCHAK